MNVYGKEVTEDLERVALFRMERPFRCADIVRAIESADSTGPRGFSLRVADRLIQRESRAGRIVKGDKFGDWKPNAQVEGPERSAAK